MKKNGFLISKDEKKYACSYTMNGKHVGGELIDSLSDAQLQKTSITKLELEDGTVCAFTGTMSLDGARESKGGPMLMKKFSGTL
jgi:hypothetical protein